MCAPSPRRRSLPSAYACSTVSEPGECGDDASVRLAEQPLGLVECALPGHFLEAATPHAQDRVAQSVLRVEVRVRETTLVAEPAVVDLGMVSGKDALDLALARRRVDVAADGTHPADGRDVLDLPWPGFEAIRRGRERTDRAELDHVAAERRPVGLVPERCDHRAGAAVDGDELAVLGDAFAEASAAITEDAALAVECDQRRNGDRLLERALRKRHARVAGAVAERQVLQRALAALVADGAVQRVVDEDELERRVLCLGGDLRRQRGAHDHPVLCGERAGGLRLRRAGLHLAEAHPAGADGRPEPGLVAEDGNLDPGGQRGLDEARPLRHLDGDAVDRERDGFGRAHRDVPPKARV